LLIKNKFYQHFELIPPLQSLPDCPASARLGRLSLLVTNLEYKTVNQHDEAPLGVWGQDCTVMNADVV
jgi:hypothetical protein